MTEQTQGRELAPDEQDAAAAARKTVEILVNEKSVHVPPHVTGAGIKAAAHVPADSSCSASTGAREIRVPDGSGCTCIATSGSSPPPRSIRR